MCKIHFLASADSELKRYAISDKVFGLAICMFLIVCLGLAGGDVPTHELVGFSSVAYSGGGWGRCLTRCYCVRCFTRLVRLLCGKSG